MNVSEATKKELRDHELPVTITANIVVTPNFSYVVDDLNKESAGECQPNLLINTPEIADLLIDLLPATVGGLALYQERCIVTGLLRDTQLAFFPRYLYQITELVIYPSGRDIVILDGLLSV